MAGVHDHFVLGYSVDATTRSILIQTEFRDQGEPFTRINVRFEHVLGYYFRDNLGGILFDIEEVPFEVILDQYADLFEWGSRFAWPWIEAIASEPEDHFKAAGGNAYWVQSSIGFAGFVISKSMTFEAVP